jgi:hypothetical protein
MLPLGSEYDEIYANMNAAEYERTGRVIRLGHTSATLAQAETVTETLKFLSNTEAAFAASFNVKQTIGAMLRIPDRKVTPRDTAFLVKMTELLEKRELIFRNRWLQSVSLSIIIGAVFWFMRVVGENTADLFFRGTLALFLVGAICFGAIFIRRNGVFRDWSDDTKLILLVLVLSYFLGGLVRFDETMATPAIAHLFSFSVGFVSAFTAYFAWKFQKISRNSEEILDACDFYSDDKPPRLSSG